VRDTDEKGKPIPRPAEFYIDASICMSCGFCAEFCPFDAIQMDHEYELTSYERHESWVYDLQELLHPAAYHAAIHPTDYQAEVTERRAKEAARQAAEKARASASPPAAPDEEALARQRKAEARQRFLEQRARQKAEREQAEGGEPS